MILLIIPIVLLIAYVVWFVYSRQFVDIGRVYVRMSANIIAIIDESEILEGKELSKLSNLKMVTDHFSAEYDPKDPKAFFSQLEFAYLMAQDNYSKIEHREINFRSEDWKQVQLYHTALESIYSQIRLLKWQNFGLN